MAQSLAGRAFVVFPGTAIMVTAIGDPDK